jgi:hypothetical protein
LRIFPLIIPPAPQGHSDRAPPPAPMRPTSGGTSWWPDNSVLGGTNQDTLWLCQNNYGKSPFIVDFPMKNCDCP